MTREEAEREHAYTSTACFHGLHERCRKTCKFCDVLCRCLCHAILSTEAGAVSLPLLTPREYEVVERLCRGMKNKQIAVELSITVDTVKVHVMHIFQKAGVRGRSGRTELALRKWTSQRTSLPGHEQTREPNA